jgi:hypothetical protein
MVGAPSSNLGPLNKDQLLQQSEVSEKPADANPGSSAPARRHCTSFAPETPQPKAQRTRSNSNEKAAKSMKLIDTLPLITVCLRGRVLRAPQWMECCSDFEARLNGNSENETIVSFRANRNAQVFVRR